MSDPLELSLTLYPDPVLRKAALPVETFDEELEQLVAAMYRCMFESRGVGLAAPQVGLRKRVLVLNEKSDPKAPDANLTLVNPRIVERGGGPTVYEEGCLSFPDIYAEVERPDRCVVEAVDVRGEPVRHELAGFVSRIVQHEYDHLEGILLVDRMSPADKLKNRAALEELVDRYRSSRVGG